MFQITKAEADIRAFQLKSFREHQQIVCLQAGSTALLFLQLDFFPHLISVSLCPLVNVFSSGCICFTVIFPV